MRKGGNGMKVIDGKKYYTAKEVGMLVGRTHLTVHLWDTWSNELAQRGEARLIPAPIKIGKQKTRYWCETDIPAIEAFAKNIQRGDLAEFSKRQWGKRQKEETRKKANVSEKKIVKLVESKKELSLEEKIVYAFIFFLHHEGREITEASIEDCFRWDKEKIMKILQRLTNLCLIAKVEEKYVLI
jgi:hypothetical protein